MGFEDLPQPGDQREPGAEDYIEAYESLEAAVELRGENLDQELNQALNATGSVEDGLSEADQEIKTAGATFKKTEPAPDQPLKWENLDQLSQAITARLLSEILLYGEQKLPKELIDSLREQILPEITKTITENEQLLIKGLPDQAGDNLDRLVASVKQNLPSGYWETLAEEITALREGKADKGKLLRFGSLALDIIPFLGSAKMLTESMMGKTLDGQELTGWKRLLKGVEGGAFLALDLAGVGLIGKITKAASPATKLFTSSAAAMRKMGVTPQVYRAVYKTGKFVSQHPAFARFLDKKVLYLATLRSQQMSKLGGFSERL